MIGMFDPTYLFIVMLPTVILSGLAQWYVQSAYGKWSQLRNTAGLAGADVARRIMGAAPELRGVRLEGTPGELSDHFDPRSNTVRMSPGIAQRPSVASMAIVAHELGHAQQYAEKSPLISARQLLLPAVQIGPNVAYGLILFGLIAQASGLLWLGIIVFGLSVLFMLLTLPVEIDASRRGLALLRQAGLMQTETDSGGSREVLTAAALTYVAAAVSSLLTLLYYVMLAQRSNRD
jgi:Zn-dependent membrane protease YugP